MNLANSILMDFLVHVGGGILFFIVISLAASVAREGGFRRIR